MQKWEYLHIRVHYSNEIDYIVDLVIFNGAPTRDSEMEISNYLNDLGTEGWELVNAHPRTVGWGVFYFKRPLE